MRRGPWRPTPSRDTSGNSFRRPNTRASRRTGQLTLYNPMTGKNDRTFQPPAGGRGYLRTASLVSIWATAPFLHNNSLGTFSGDPSVAAGSPSSTTPSTNCFIPRTVTGSSRSSEPRRGLILNIRLSVLGSAALEKIRAIKPKLPDLPDFKLPEVFQLVETRDFERHAGHRRARPPVNPDRHPGGDADQSAGQHQCVGARRNGCRPFWRI